MFEVVTNKFNYLFQDEPVATKRRIASDSEEDIPVAVKKPKKKPKKGKHYFTQYFSPGK